MLLDVHMHWKYKCFIICGCQLMCPLVRGEVKGKHCSVCGCKNQTLKDGKWLPLKRIVKASSVDLWFDIVVASIVFIERPTIQN